MTDKREIEVQSILYVWLSKLGKRRLESIKASCDYMAKSRNIIVSNPIWAFFWPMVFSGVVDYAGRGYYSLTEPLILNYHTHFYYINYRPIGCKYQEVSVGIYISNTLVNDNGIKVIRVDPRSILKRFPSVDKVVDAFPESMQDETELKYYNWKNKRGVAELEKEGLKRIFSIPEEVYIIELPSRTINPDAFAIAYCYGRVINDESNGTYYKDKKELVTSSFAMPFMLYRVLQLETMASRYLPEKDGDSYIFNSVSQPVVNELNRILCKSIKYE